MRKSDRRHDPLIQVEQGNGWYTDDQFKTQLGHPGSRAVIENRWRFFEQAIRTYLTNRQSEAPSTRFRFLEIGCGDGINLHGLLGLARQNDWDMRVHAFDYNQLRASRAANIEGVAAVGVADITALPIADGSGDIVLCNHVLEHVAEDVMALCELRRIVSDGGLVLLGVPNEGCAVARLRNHVVQRSILRRTDHIHFYTSRTFLAKVRKAGLRPLLLGGGGVFFPHAAVNRLLGVFNGGARLMMSLGRLIPSQSGDLLMVACRDDCRP